MRVVPLLISVSVNADASEGTQELTASVRYQACNDTTCLPPRTLASLPVTISAKTLPADAKKTPSPTPTVWLRRRRRQPDFRKC